MKRMLLVLNPGSCAGHGRRHWAFWLNALRGCSEISLEHTETSVMADARRLASEADDVDAVVAVGGDGTINGVINGLMDRPEPRPAMGVLYSGTSPDFCRFHSIATEPGRALATLMAFQERSVDIARIHYHDATGSGCTGYFGSSTNVGIGARVAAISNRWRPFLGDKLGTALAVLVSASGKHLDITIKLDDASPICLHRCCNLTVAKNPFIASGLRLNASLAPDDGVLSVLGVHDRGIFSLIRLLPSFYLGKITDAQGILYGKCHRAKITSDAPCAVEFDGDPQGFLPAEIEILPGSLRLITGGTR